MALNATGLIFHRIEPFFLPMLHRNIIALQMRQLSLPVRSWPSWAIQVTRMGSQDMFVSKLIGLLHAWWRYDESVRELSRLSDRELADIGVNRSDIARLAWRNARWR
jgi:uncharacterized protein YjiS (DUF1127 family)